MKIAKCHFCKNTGSLHVGITWFYNEQYKFVKCMHCGAEGPKIKGADDEAMLRALHVWEHGIV